jgi:hypothetical protein
MAAAFGNSWGNALKWFPSWRGLAADLTAAGFGAGSALERLRGNRMRHFTLLPGPAMAAVYLLIFL